MSRLFARHGDDDMEMPYDASRHGPDNRPPSDERMAAMLHHDNWYTMQRYENRALSRPAQTLASAQSR